MQTIDEVTRDEEKKAQPNITTEVIPGPTDPIPSDQDRKSSTEQEPSNGLWTIKWNKLLFSLSTFII